jgi:hypothetical protein
MEALRQAIAAQHHAPISTPCPGPPLPCATHAMTTIDTAPSRTFALRTTAPQDQGDGGTVWVAMASGANAPGPSVVITSDSATLKAGETATIGQGAGIRLQTRRATALWRPIASGCIPVAGTGPVG